MSSNSLFPYRSILVTGATGFVGRALVERLVHIKTHNAADMSIVLVARSKVEWIEVMRRNGQLSEVIESDFSRRLECTHPIDLVFHCATPASAELNALAPRSMLDQNIKAMNWVVDSEVVKRDHPTVFFTSSGAVYGPQPLDLSHISEEYTGSPDTTDARSAYAEGKRVAEYILCEAGTRELLIPLIGRLFAFSGIGLPLDRHFAVGNFVNDARNGRPIEIRGSGRDIRSYLDVKDMVDWILAVATAQFAARPFNIGSDRALTIRELAECVASRAKLLLGHDVPIKLKNQTSIIDGNSLYVPSVKRIVEELGVAQTVALEDSIDQMLTQ